MKPTKATTLIALALTSGVSAFIVANNLSARGFATPLTPINLSVTLTCIAITLIALAIPMLRYRAALKEAKTKPKRVPPFYAIRVVALAKSTALAGSLFLGWHVGLLCQQLTHPEPNLLPTILGLVASLLATAAGVIVEQIFRVPPDSTDVPLEGTPA